MHLLVLESRDDDPVVRSTLTGVTKALPLPELKRTITKDGPGSLTHSQTSVSLTSMNSSKSAPPMVTQIDNAKDEKIMYPFRVRHLGKETYTLYAPSSQNRDDWCNKIVEAKTKHARALFAQNAEPFKLQVLADTAFAYDAVSGPQAKSITMIKGTPLDRAVREVERQYVHAGRPPSVCRSRVNCATSFNSPDGKEMVAIGTDFGVFVSEKSNPRGWSKVCGKAANCFSRANLLQVISSPRVTQLAVLEEFALFLLISEKALIAYHLDLICPPGGGPPNADASGKRAPQKISGNRDVGFFASGRMKDRTLVFYKKRDGISSTFKVMTVRLPRLNPVD